MNPNSENILLLEERATQSGHVIGVITLNSPKTLNSLTVSMIAKMTEALISWQSRDDVVCVWLHGAGEKGLCAGGDIQALYRSMVASDSKENDYAREFFETEYRLDYLIHQYTKPIICWGDGIVMGGGMGLMAGATFRIVTEKSRLAMPEITIGLYPDVGGTWFLNRMPGNVGLFLGLTGASINASDALFAGLADRFIASEQKHNVMNELENLPWGVAQSEYHGLIFQALADAQVSSESLLPASKVREYYDLINTVTDQPDLPSMIGAITELDTDDKWLLKAQASLLNGCPTTAALVYWQITEGKFLSLKEVFQQELIISMQCALHPEFAEGVRALLIEKDMQPKWQHENVSVMDESWLNEFLAAPWVGENPLDNL